MKALIASARLHGALISVVAVVTLANPAIASADTVTEWNANASSALFAVQDVRVATLHLAMVHGAMYDAVNAIDGGHQGYLLSPRLASPGDSKEAAAATAAHRVLVSILPEQQAALTTQYEASLAPIADGSSKTRGIAVGEAAAAAMLAARTDDGRFGTFRFLVGAVPRMAAGLARLRERPQRVAEGHQAIFDPEPGGVSVQGTVVAHEPCVRAGVRRGEVAWLGHERDPHGRSDARRALLGGEPANTWSRTFRTLSTQADLSMSTTRAFSRCFT